MFPIHAAILLNERQVVLNSSRKIECVKNVTI